MSSRLDRTELLRESAFINGQWRRASDAIQVVNPIDGSIVGVAPNFGAAETVEAVEAAETASALWRRRTAGERAAFLRKWQAAILANAEDLARIITLEEGKPLAEARGEIASGAAYVGWFAEEARRIYGETIPAHAADKRFIVNRAPVGVVAAVTPWNFPSSMIPRKVAPALAAGCAVVLKPSELTPFSALALAMLAEEAGAPPGLFSVVTGDPAPIGDVLVSHPSVRKFTFTGSTAIGKMLAARCMGTVKRVSLELGGNAPFIVFEDADVEKAVAAAMLAKFRNAGQTCISANRFLVHERVYDSFAAALAERAFALQVGDGFLAETTMGPLINKQAVAKFQRHAKDALDKGARPISGAPEFDDACLQRPVILRDVDPSSQISREETFGPLAGLIRIRNEAEAVAWANGSASGLAAYVFTNDIARMHRVTERLDFGMVGVNSAAIVSEAAPFGGVKESGLGREGARQGIEDYLDVKLICVDVPEEEPS